MNVKVSVVQDSPVFFEKKQTIQKIEETVDRLAKEGSQLIVLPESFIPGYPRGFSFGTIVGSRSSEGRDLYHEYYKNSIAADSDDTKRLEKLAKSTKTFLVIGVTEKDNISGSLYCSMFYISPHSGLLGVHRKTKPTGQERVIWHEADGSALVTFNTEIGRLGGLICWENYMPLARMAMYNKGVEIYIAPTADARDSWTATMRHIALEGRCFVLGCNQYFKKSMYPDSFRSLLDEENVVCRGGSLIVNPMGEIIEGPLYDQTGILTTEINLNEIVKSKLDFDVIGHYSRDDIFKLEIVNQPDIKNDSDPAKSSN